MHLAIYYYGAFGSKVPATLILGTYAEKENGILIVRVQMELESYDTSQSFDSPAQVGVTCGNVDLFEIPGITQHETSP